MASSLKGVNMSKYVFLYKKNDTDDRDCVKYLDVGRPIFECDHYFRNIGLTGACFSCGLDMSKIDFDHITTHLTKEEFVQIDQYNTAVSKLRCGITIDDERYQKGMKLYNRIVPILNKLKSIGNTALFEMIKEEEAQYLIEKYGLSYEDVKYIFDNYGLDYRDRAVVGTIFEDIDEASREEAESMGYVNKQNERYFDYDKFGSDLLENDSYLELPDGRIVYLCY
jgi:hypothetical protein